MSDGLSAGVDLGGTKCVIGWVGDDGALLDRERFPSPRTPGEFVEQVAGRVRLHPTASIGIGVPGFVSRDRSRVIRCPNLPAYVDHELARAISDATGIPAWLENDANAAALAEARFGAGSSYGDQLFVILGTGVGGGIIANGDVVRGAGYAGEIGHITIDPEGELCGCGRRGCWEMFASGRALARIAGVERGEEVAEAVAEGRDWALRALDQFGSRVAEGLADLVLALAPELVVLGGGVSDIGAPLVEVVRTRLRPRIPSYLSLPDIAVAQLGNDAGVIGAALARP